MKNLLTLTLILFCFSCAIKIENRCSKCYSKDVVRMVWGLPSQQSIEAQERGEIALGSCMPHGYNNFCNNCDNGF